MGGLEQKCPPWGDGGDGYFLELHNGKAIGNRAEMGEHAKLVEKFTMPVCKCPNVTEKTELRRIYSWACSEAA